MCKVIAFSNLSQVKRMRELVDLSARLVAESERDGFGYAIQTRQGVYGERSLEPRSFRYGMNRPKLDAPYVSHKHETFGSRAKAIGAGIFHGRTSTNEISLRNTHPLCRDGWSLVHNGVVSNHGPKYKMNTSNDTEHLLHYLSTTGLSGIEKHITGYLAIAAIDPDGVLHIARDSIAPLSVSYIQDIDSLMFATKAEHITDLCGALNWTCSVPAPVNDNTYLRFNRGVLDSHETWTPRGRTQVESAWASKSLGRELDPLVKVSPRFAPDNAMASRWDLVVESESRFFEEIEQLADSSYLFLDYKNTELSYADFMKLPDDHKLCCTVIRPDGTILDQTDYTSERLWTGAV